MRKKENLDKRNNKKEGIEKGNRNKKCRNLRGVKLK